MIKYFLLIIEIMLLGPSCSEAQQKSNQLWTYFTLNVPYQEKDILLIMNLHLEQILVTPANGKA